MEYWISLTSLPDQSWAILEEKENINIVRYSDNTIEYPTEKDAIRELQEDEYSPFKSLSQKDEKDLEVPLSMLHPPVEGEPLYVAATERFVVKPLESVFGNSNEVCIYKECSKKVLNGKSVCAIHYSKYASNK